MWKELFAAGCSLSVHLFGLAQKFWDPHFGDDEADRGRQGQVAMV